MTPMKTLAALALALALAFAAAGAAAQAASPVGLWRTIDDETKQEKSLVRIAESAGVFSGKVEKITDPAKAQAQATCEACTDDRKGRPVVGMTILRGVKAGTDAGTWDGGDILDPNNGKVYKVRLKPADGGKTMEVRGYIGPFFRNQQWTRVE